jgi:hypothetical protein
MARATLQHYPQLDVVSYLGLHVPADAFILVAGATELLFGLLVLSGAMPQLAMLVAAVPFNATLLIFGAAELLGHLPVYGVFLTLLAYGSDRRTAGDVRWLPRPRLRRRARPRDRLTGWGPAPRGAKVPPVRADPHCPSPAPGRHGGGVTDRSLQ